MSIHDVQGSGSVSPFLGQLVQLDTSVVTFANSEFAYIQDAEGDGDPNTSEGLLIDDGNTFQLVPGDRVLISGQVQELSGQTALGASVTINKLSSGTPLTPVAFDPGTSLVNGASPLERFEGMLLNFSVTAASGSDDFNSVDVHVTSVDRPFREPGLLPPGLPDLPVFDGNPELMNYDPNGLGQSNFIFHNAGDVIEGTGILEQFSFGYELSPIEPTTVELVEPTRPVRARTDDEITVASLNTLFLRNDESDYGLRLNKIVAYIGEQLHFPDVLAIQETGGSDEIEDLIFRLRQLDPELGDYQGFAPPDEGFLNVAYLVHNRIDPPAFTELGSNEFCSCGGFLHNRPPLLVELNVPGDESTTLRVLNLHIRSLNGVDDDVEVRIRRNEQAISIANMVENLRDENLVVVGDYNAFQFTDGYVDVFNQISGLPSLGAQFPVEEIVNPPLVNAAASLPEEEQYSFVFQGSAQQLDHCLHNELSGLTVNEFAFARGNSDASINYANNAFQLARASDHDGFVLYLGIDELSSTKNTNTRNLTSLRFVNPSPAGAEIQFYNLPADAIVTLTDVLGRELVLAGLQSSSAGGSSHSENGSFLLPQNLIPGSYRLTVRSGSRLLSSQQILINH
ncbi:hypothetical protein CEQ90_16020 [Lewinellaceae bacterium SD302]|nr:hypothetical protein CEQ90_16020 [Lewinellaceae bacterium SD302]